MNVVQDTKVDFDWAGRAAVNYLESDSVAVIRRRENSLAWLPVFLREADDAPFVKVDGDWIPVDGLLGFLRYEKSRTKKFYDTAKGKLVNA